MYSYFDPLGFSVLNDRERTIVEREVKQMPGITLSRASDSTTSPASNVMEKTHSNDTAVNAFLQSVGFESIITKGKRATLTEEFRTYRRVAAKFVETGGADSTALRFWSTHTDGLPMLSTFARRFLAAPGTSVPSESAFSVSSFTGRKERCRLTPENLAATVFLKDKL
jgi:hAT family C-terminal dimerisation region